MFVRDAFWQQKNLGVTSTEFEFNKDDSLEDVQEIIHNATTEYDVAFVGDSRVDIVNLLEDNGFKYIETIVSFKRGLKQVIPSKVIARLKSKVELHECEDMSSIYNEINKGMFDTDRITVDPYFKDVNTSHRYINRMEEEKANLRTFTLNKGNEEVGFISIKDCGNNKWFSFLGGAYKSFDGQGLGYLAIYYGLELAQSFGGKKIVTGTSSNNLASVKIHLDIGYSITDMQPVLVRHK